MNRTVIVIAVALASFASVVQATQKDNTWYAGGKMGWSRLRETNWCNNILENDGPIYDGQPSMGAFSGYQINPYVGFEIGYDWLHHVLSYKNASTIDSVFKIQGVQLTTRLSYPVTNDLGIYTRFGSMVWRINSSNNFLEDDHNTGISPVLTGGLEWFIDRNVSVRLEYQWIHSISDNNTSFVRSDSNMLGIGISYKFGRQKESSVTSLLPNQEVQTKRFTLKSKVLFDFNKSTIKPESKQILDQLLTQLNDLDPKDGSILVMGFADHIGSISYNQVLSEKRAQSVVNYLISKGIQSTKIFSRGMGKSNLALATDFDNTCEDVKDHSSLIECLTPNRRVEIEVKGVKDIVIHPTM